MGLCRHLKICVYAEVENIQVEKEIKCERPDCPYLDNNYDGKFCSKCRKIKEDATRIIKKLVDKVSWQELNDAIREDVLCFSDYKNKVIFTGNKQGDSVLNSWCEEDEVVDFSTLDPSKETAKFSKKYAKEIEALKNLYGSVEIKFGMVFSIS